jgi:hypothetical protein
MAMKWKILGLTRKFEIVCLYEDDSSSKIKIRRWHRLTSILLTILNNKVKIWPAVLCDGRLETQKSMRISENEDLKSVLFTWFCKERSVGVPTDGPHDLSKSQYFHGKIQI